MPKPADKGKKDNSIVPIDGTDASEFLEGTLDADIIYGLAGNDFIDALAGNDTVYGGDGDDIIIGGSGDDALFGEAGDDSFVGGAGSDAIDGGDGNDTVAYWGTEGTDYTVELVYGKGRNRDTVEAIHVIATDGSVDTLTNINEENIFFFGSTFIAADDTAGLDATTSASVTIDVRDNDAYSVSYSEEPISGSDLVITAIADVSGGNLLPVGTVFADFSDPAGVHLNDGSNLKLNNDGTLTFTASDSLAADTTYSFDYTVSYGGVETVATVSFDVTTGASEPPGPAETLTLEALTQVDANLGPYYADGSYAITQLTQGFLGLVVTVEERDSSATSYDYDGDLDEEWRVWTEADGTLHDMTVTTVANAEATLDGDLATSPNEEFIFESFKLTGLDTGEGVTVEYYDVDGNPLGTEYIDSVSDLSPDGVFASTFEGSVGQISFSADVGTEVYIDDIVLL